MLYAYNTVDDTSYIRILHAVPDAPPVDVYANDNLIAKRLPYKKFTQYLKVPGGQYDIAIYPYGKKDTSLFETTVDIPPRSIYTFAASGLLPDIGLLQILDPEMAIPPGKACVRFGHLSPDAPAVDITLPDGTVLFEDVSFEEVEDYICVNPGKYTLQARAAGTDQVVLTVPNIHLHPNRFYSVYAVGLLDGKPGLQVLIPLDGNSYIDV